ncbi:hypothetical protein [Serratia quinivorans]|uniref:hypothetical protein n=1 Tax=Serratia quinivorans TaxID=137545 RepID=UPI0021787017|nr:hypothetical protein [Serratia quinivorans]CAI1113456.1 Uncharacterised protein [Serratia quinivorans]CAI1875294.1 Uncharacterised protein [Serratia quinivorans]
MRDSLFLLVALTLMVFSLFSQATQNSRLLFAEGTKTAYRQRILQHCQRSLDTLQVLRDPEYRQYQQGLRHLSAATGRTHDSPYTVVQLSNPSWFALQRYCQRMYNHGVRLMLHELLHAHQAEPDSAYKPTRNA